MQATAKSRFALLALLACALGSGAGAGAEDKAAAASGAEAKPSPASGRLSPVFPESPPGLVYVEGEDAVSTNMATEPTLNYGCSGNRTLQLSRSGALPGGAAYYAEFTFFIDKAGSYELWYGGTPPGSKDEFTLSFASPVSVALDGGPAKSLFREDVNVVERYAPAYYWVRTPSLQLSQGAHVLRFEVTAKRRLDDRFFFYIDALFLASPEAFAAYKEGGTDFPALFPKDPSDRTIDHPFRSVEDYQAEIQAKPAVLAPYIELADEYSLSGDYLNALKTLANAAVVAPRDPDVRLLAAKNRIWRGDVKEGIEAYGLYISLRPNDLDAYEEAGKIAAWSGRFSDSEYFYVTGLAAFPGNASLTVNKGLSLLWASRVPDAERDFASAEKAALAAPGSASELADIYRENGFPDRAIAVYEKAIAAFPNQLGLYLDEGALLASLGRDKAEKDLEARISAVFEPSSELDAALAKAASRRQLKADRIAELESQIAAKPSDFGLRDELTRVYAWNGRKAEAARELESILAARFARAISESDSAMSEVFDAQFAAAALRADAESRLASLAALRAKAQAAQTAADKAMAELRDRDKAEAAAAAAGKSAPSADSARAAAASALAALAESLTALAGEDARASLLAQRGAALAAAFEAIAARDASDEKAFQAIAAGIGWSYSGNYAVEELSVPAARGEQIAALARARVLIAAKDSNSLAAAQASLASVGSGALAEDRARADLMIKARRDYRSIYKAALDPALIQPGLAEAARELAAVAAALPPADASSPAAPPEGSDSAALDSSAGDLRSAYAALLDADSLARKAAESARAQLASLVQGAADLEDRRLRRAWHDFEAAALDLRSELGSYYDGLGQAGPATKQYRRVLALDPSNIRAMHSLALAEEKAGDWAAAASLFKAVNSADPYYLNAASLYNGIARAHAPGFDSSTGFVSDLNLFDYRSSASLTMPLGSFLALKPSVEVRSIRDRNLGFPAYIGATAGLEAPISFALGSGSDSLVLRPSASLIVTSADFSAIGAATVDPAQFLQSLSLYSAGGAALDWRFGPWSGSASYAYAPIPDSLNPALQDALPAIYQLFAHKVELSASAYLPAGRPFRYFAPRLYATGSYVPADGANVFGTALLELIPGFRISDSPWINLGLPLDLVYEDSKDAHTSPYYSADQALTAKGGLLWQASYPLKDGQTLSFSLEGMGGLYMSQAFKASPAKDLYLYGFARADWTRGDATYFLSVEASATDPFVASPKYWSFSILGGIGAKQPALIAP
jgi:tetratricopeptide (TPR) repeat protein